MKFNFKSSGIKSNHRKFDIPESAKASKQRPIGLKTPILFGNDRTELFDMHMNIIDQFKDNLRNLVQTNQGERLGRFNFGCNLKSLLFERSNLDNEFNEKATQNIIEQVKTYLPLFQIDDIAFKSENKFPHDTTSLAKITVNIKYSIPKLRLSNKQLEVILYCGG